jgi:hypothetical protein
MTKLELWKNLQNLVNDYMIDRKEWKDVERIRDWMRELLKTFKIWFSTRIGEDAFLEWKMRLLDELYNYILEKEHGEKMQKAVKEFMTGFLQRM